MKWNKKPDTFTLTRSEACDLMLFAVAWMSESKRKRPMEYEEFHRKVLQPLNALLLQYMREPSFWKELRKMEKGGKN